MGAIERRAIDPCASVSTYASVSTRGSWVRLGLEGGSGNQLLANTSSAPLQSPQH